MTRARVPVRRRTAQSAHASVSLPLQCRALGLPEPELEFYFARPRKFRADFAWPDHKLIL